MSVDTQPSTLPVGMRVLRKLEDIASVWGPMCCAALVTHSLALLLGYYWPNLPGIADLKPIGRIWLFTIGPIWVALNLLLQPAYWFGWIEPDRTFRRKFRLIGAGALFCLLAMILTGAMALPPVSVSVRNDVLVYEGHITDEGTIAIARSLAARGCAPYGQSTCFERLLITSPGGSVSAALTINEMLNRAGIARVHAEKECLSACTTLLLAMAKERFVSPRTNIGFHSALNGDLVIEFLVRPLIAGKDFNPYVSAWLQYAGMRPELADRLTTSIAMCVVSHKAFSKSGYQYRYATIDKSGVVSPASEDQVATWSADTYSRCGVCRQSIEWTISEEGEKPTCDPPPASALGRYLEARLSSGLPDRPSEVDAR